jgi:hypothetical protein
MRILATLAGALALVPSLVRAYTNPVIYEDLVSPPSFLRVSSFLIAVAHVLLLGRRRRPSIQRHVLHEHVDFPL